MPTSLVAAPSGSENLEIHIEFTENIIDFLAEKGFDDIYGARPLRREIQRSVEDPLSEKILGGEFSKGSKIKCDFIDEKVVFM